MEKNDTPVSLKKVVESIRTKTENPEKVSIYRFDIFKGAKDANGKIAKIKSVGSSYVRDGLKTYTVHLKALLKDTFYLLPNTRRTTSKADFVILTRELSQNSGRKYFWNNVGEGTILEGANHGLMHLSWDVLMADDLYMTLHPLNISEMPDAVKLTSEAA